MKQLLNSGGMYFYFTTVLEIKQTAKYTWGPNVTSWPAELVNIWGNAVTWPGTLA